MKIKYRFNSLDIVGISLLLVYLNPFSILFTTFYFLKNIYYYFQRNILLFAILSYSTFSLLIGKFYTGDYIGKGLYISNLAAIILTLYLKNLVLKNQITLSRYLNYLTSFFLVIVFIPQLIDYLSNYLTGTPLLLNFLSRGDDTLIEARLAGSLSFRTGGLFGPNEAGLVSLMVAIINFFVYRKIIYKFVIVFIVFSSLLFSSSLSALGLLLILLSSFLLVTSLKVVYNLIFKLKLKKSFAILLVSLSIFLITVASYFSLLDTETLYNSNRMAAFFIQNQSTIYDYYVSSRFQYVNILLSQFNVLDHIIGRGMGSWTYDVYNLTGLMTLSNAHNTFLQIYYDMGLLGLLVFGFWWLKTFIFSILLDNNLYFQDRFILTALPAVVLLSSFVHNLAFSMIIIFYLNFIHSLKITNIN